MIGNANTDCAANKCLDSRGGRSKLIRLKNLAVGIANFNKAMEDVVKDPLQCKRGNPGIERVPIFLMSTSLYQRSPERLKQEVNLNGENALTNV